VAFSFEISSLPVAVPVPPFLKGDHKDVFRGEKTYNMFSQPEEHGAGIVV